MFVVCVGGLVGGCAAAGAGDPIGVCVCESVGFVNSRSARSGFGPRGRQATGGDPFGGDAVPAAAAESIAEGHRPFPSPNHRPQIMHTPVADPEILQNGGEQGRVRGHDRGMSLSLVFPSLK